ncbi:MAG: glycosyltransferase family 2 protein [Alphaproteobacteria bacterium]
MDKIPVSVIVTTKNEEGRIGACLAALQAFDDVWVVDSNSEDRTREIARAYGARVEDFEWNGAYPKKRGWCLDHLDLKYERVFFVDADEVVPGALVDEIAALNWACAGYFVSGQYVFEGRQLRHGLRNNKLVLFDRRKVAFPVVDDLGIEGMGEMEGHYQPVLKGTGKLGQLQTPLVHQAYEDGPSWEARHFRYAHWEAGMNAQDAWPEDPVKWRQRLKRVFRALPFRGGAAFVHCYVFKLGFLDGWAGYRFARSRARYYRMILDASKARGRFGGVSTQAPEGL